MTYRVELPDVPGGRPVYVDTVSTLREARAVAQQRSSGRNDLRWQDVRIESEDGSLVEYAGPGR